jgi:membrane fusion protein (multidrug efflux system)
MKWFLSGWMIILLLSGCGHEDDKLHQRPPILVSTIIVQAKDVPVSFEYVAQTQSSHMVNIQARVNGFLDKKIYTEGEIVKAGQVLFLMDMKPYQVQVDAAKAALAKQDAALENARLNLARVEPLAKLHALSQKDLDDATGAFQTNNAAVDQAKAQLETAQLNLSYCTITSPFEGVTGAALLQEGSYLNMVDSKLTTVSALTPIWVNFSLSENQVQQYADQVAKGYLIAPRNDQFDVKVIQVNGKVFPYTGKITFTEPYFNPQTGTFLIRASVDNPDGALRPNQYVRVRVEGAIRPKAILVPQRAVQQSSKGSYVWVVDKDNSVEFRPVTVGDWHGQEWFIIDGLQSGDQVVVDGVVGLHMGDTVQPRNGS